MIGYLQRSHASYSWRPLAATYLIVLTLTVAVVLGISLLNESGMEIVNGLPFATDIPGLDCSRTTTVSQWKGWFGSGFVGFVRLIPVPDDPEQGTTPLSEVYSFGREDQDGSALPTSYCPIFSESDLMNRPSIRYKIYQFRILDYRGRSAYLTHY